MRLTGLLRNSSFSIAGAQAAGPYVPALEMCAEHVRQFEGESPLPNLMEVKG